MLTCELVFNILMLYYVINQNVKRKPAQAPEERNQSLKASVVSSREDEIRQRSQDQHYIVSPKS